MTGVLQATQEIILFKYSYRLNSSQEKKYLLQLNKKRINIRQKMSGINNIGVVFV
jgi:hypothetical protein